MEGEIGKKNKRGMYQKREGKWKQGYKERSQVR